MAYPISASMGSTVRSRMTSSGDDGAAAGFAPSPGAPGAWAFPPSRRFSPPPSFLDFPLPVDPVAHEGQETAEKKEGDGGQPRHQGQGEEQHCPDEEGAGIIGQGGENIPAQVRLTRRPGDDDACGGGEQQCGNLGDETVTHRQEAVQAQGLFQGESPLEHPDGQSADDVDDGDDKPGDRVSLDELGRAVHGSVEVGLPLDGEPPFPGARLVDEPGVQIGVDGHLFSRHGVQGEPRRHFRHPFRALGDDDELDDHENEEDHTAHDVVSSHHEIAEGADDLPRIAVQQDEPRGGNVEGETEQGDDQEHCGERGEIEGPLGVEG